MEDEKAIDQFHDDGNPNHIDGYDDDDGLQAEIDEFEANEYAFWPDYSDGLY